MSEYAAYFRPAGLDGIEALHARFVRHAYRPHSHPTWTVAVVERGAARFTVDATDQRAGSGELFVLEPEAVHTGHGRGARGLAVQGALHRARPAAVLGGARCAGPTRGALDRLPRSGPARALLDAHRALADEPPGLAVDEAVLRAVDGLRPHLRPGPPRPGGGRGEHAAVRRAVAHLREHWDAPVPLVELSAVAGLSRFELVRRFGAQIGLTPHAFQTNLRIARARELLAGGVAPAAVAAACGFADQAHLTRTFRVAVGVPPARYAAATTFKT